MKSEKLSKALLILLSAVIFTSCGSAAGSSSASYYNADSAAATETASASDGIYTASRSLSQEESYDEGSSGSSETLPEDADVSADPERKLIRNMDFSVETTDLDSLSAAIEEKTSELGGYVESSSVDGNVYSDPVSSDEYGYNEYGFSKRESISRTRQTRYAWYTVRIPAEKLDQFARALEEGSNVTSQSTSTEDITLSYVDVESRRNSLQEELDQLQDMFKDAETVEDMIQIQAQITSVRSDLESLESQLRVLDSQVRYSTVNINITETQILTDLSDDSDLTVGQRIQKGFMNSAQEMLWRVQEIGIWIAENAPMILFYIVVILIILLLIRLLVAILRGIFGSSEKRLRKTKEKLERKEQKKLAKQAKKK